MGEFDRYGAPGFHRPRISESDLLSTTPTRSLFDYECPEKASICLKAQSRMTLRHGVDGAGKTDTVLAYQRARSCDESSLSSTLEALGDYQLESR